MREIPELSGFDRSPPWSQNAEVAVIGAALIAPDAVTEIVANLEERDFYREAHRRLYRAIRDLYDRGETVDVITLSEILKARGELNSAGGFDYLAGLMDAVPTAANLEYHIAIVSEKAILRRIIEASSNTIRDAYEAERGSADELSQEAERRIFEATRSRSAGRFIWAKEVLWDAFEAIEKEASSGGGVTGLPTGIPRLDHLTAGFQDGDLTVLAARPSMGKTAFALGSSMTVAAKAGPVTIESLEMSNVQLMKRLLAMEGRIDLLKLRKGELTEEDHQRMARAASVVNGLPLYFDDELGGTVPGLRSKVRRLAVERPVRLVVVDYLQLMTGTGSNRIQEIGSITRGLKRLAREFECHVLALSQLSRKPESRNPPRPILSDLRDSGDIEQDADNVLLLWRPEYYFDERTPNEMWSKWQGKGELIVAKQRNGPTDRIALHWNAKTTTFTQAASKQDERRAEEAEETLPC